MIGDRRKVKKIEANPTRVTPLQNMLIRVRVREVSSVDHGGNQLSHVILAKRLRLAKAMQVWLEETATAGEAHAHGPAELPDSVIAAGTYRFGAGGAGDHEHTVTIAESMQPGDQRELLSSVGGGQTPHQHSVTIQAGAVMRRRNDAALVGLSKLFEDAPDEGVSIEEIETVLKQVDEEPRTFEEMRVDGRIHEIDAALDDRSRSFMSTTYEIILADPSLDKEALLMQAVTDFAAVMHQEIPQLFSGELQKAEVVAELMKIHEPGQSAPTLRDVQEHISKLLPSGGEGGDNVSKLFKNLNEDEKAALAKLQEGVDLAKTQAEEIVTLKTSVADLTKKAEPKKEDDDVDPLLKGLDEKLVTAISPIVGELRKEIAAGKENTETVLAQLKKQNETARLALFETFAKSLKATGVKHEEVIAQLVKADTIDGFADELMKSMTATDNTAALSLEELGTTAEGREILAKRTEAETEVGQAHEKLIKAAVEIRKGKEEDMTPERAYVLAGKADPETAAIAYEVNVN